MGDINIRDLMDLKCNRETIIILKDKSRAYFFAEAQEFIDSEKKRIEITLYDIDIYIAADICGVLRRDCKLVTNYLQRDGETQFIFEKPKS